MPGPLIGITTGAAPAKEGAPERVQVNATYLEAVQQAGGIPLILGPGLSENDVARILGSVDGLVLTGGGDADPARYGQPRHEKTAGVSSQRDAMETAAALGALSAGKPLLAICRGMQILNVALGGTLHQHVPDRYGNTIAHPQTQAGHPRDALTHSVDVQPGTRLAELVGAGTLGVNSMHHQAVDRPGSGVRFTASAPDGVVEALELTGHEGWFVAVQWHPEELTQVSPAAMALFEALVAAAR